MLSSSNFSWLNFELHSTSALFNQLRNQPRPTRLVTRPNAGAVVAMKVFVEIDVVAPLRLGLEFLEAAEHWPPPVFRPQEDPCQSPGNLCSRIPQRCPPARTRRELHRKAVAVEVVELLQ